MKTPSPNNRSVTLTEEEQTQYLSRCLRLTQPAELSAAVNRTILGDMLSVCPLLPPGCVDLMVADPPYNLRKDYHGTLFSAQDADSYAAYTRRWIEAALPLLSQHASVYICCDWRTSLVIGNVLGEYFTVKNRITWQREKGRGAMRNWKNGIEDIWFAVRGKDYVFHLDAVKTRRRVIAPYREDGAPKDWVETPRGSWRDTCPSNFWDDITIPFWSMPENTAHPTQKPEKLIAKLILASSSPGDVVFDPFLGSGTTSVTAKKLGRRYIGIEQNEFYCALAEKRLARAEGDASIQGYSGGVFWERNSLAAQAGAKNHS